MILFCDELQFRSKPSGKVLAGVHDPVGVQQVFDCQHRPQDGRILDVGYVFVLVLPQPMLGRDAAVPFLDRLKDALVHELLKVWILFVDAGSDDVAVEVAVCRWKERNDEFLL